MNVTNMYPGLHSMTENTAGNLYFVVDLMGINKIYMYIYDFEIWIECICITTIDRIEEKNIGTNVVSNICQMLSSLVMCPSWFAIFSLKGKGIFQAFLAFLPFLHNYCPFVVFCFVISLLFVYCWCFCNFCYMESKMIWFVSL